MASGSPTDPSTQRRPSHATGGPASSGMDALACSTTRQSATDSMPVSVCAVRSAVSVATTCSAPGVCPSFSQARGLRPPRTSSRSSERLTTGRPERSRRMSMNARVQRSSG